MAGQLVDAYLYHFRTTYPLVHEATFRAQFSEVIREPNGTAWLLLSKAITAIGAWYLDCGSTENSSTASLLSLADILPTPEVLGNGSITMVQVLGLLSPHLQKLNRPNMAWTYLGSAVRIALNLAPSQRLYRLENQSSRA
jgi:transcriptional regulatory protein GAL4